MDFSLASARALMLATLGLLQPPPQPSTKSDVLQTIRRLHMLQIDTIHVVARSPYFVLWSRLGHYEPQWLDELLAEGKLFEYWAHEACFLPIEDYPLYRHRMLDAVKLGWKYNTAWVQTQQAQIDAMRAHLRTHGPVRSADFERSDGRVGQWWDRKPQKRILEALYTFGEVMIARRQNFQRVYDLRERLLPDWNDSQMPAVEAVRQRWVLHTVQALGIAHATWIADYFRTPKRDTLPVMRTLVETGALLEARVEGLPGPCYVHPDNLPLAQQAIAGALRPSYTTLLSPFDPLVWDRQRARMLFNFAYTIECYTPAPKRRYGYFSLPILCQGVLLGRLDAKAHRAEGVFEVKTLHLEPGVTLTDEAAVHVAEALRACAAWHGTPLVRITRAYPATAGTLVQKVLDNAPRQVRRPGRPSRRRAL